MFNFESDAKLLLIPGSWRTRFCLNTLRLNGTYCTTRQPKLRLDDTDNITILSGFCEEVPVQPVHLVAPTGVPLLQQNPSQLGFKRCFLPLINCIPRAGSGSLLCIPWASSLHIWHLAYLIVWEYPCSHLSVPPHNATLHTLGTQL